MGGRAGGSEGGLVKDHTFAAFFLTPSLIGLDGRILALLTSKRFFSTVCELVCFQILNFSAGVVALVTPERLFPRTNGSASLSRGEKLL